MFWPLSPNMVMRSDGVVSSSIHKTMWGNARGDAQTRRAMHIRTAKLVCCAQVRCLRIPVPQCQSRSARSATLMKWKEPPSERAHPPAKPVFLSFLFPWLGARRAPCELGERCAVRGARCTVHGARVQRSGPSLRAILDKGPLVLNGARVIRLHRVRRAARITHLTFLTCAESHDPHDPAHDAGILRPLRLLRFIIRIDHQTHPPSPARPTTSASLLGGFSGGMQRISMGVCD